MFLEPEVKNKQPLAHTCGNCLYHCRYTQSCYLPERNYPGLPPLLNIRFSCLDACQEFKAKSNIVN